eukprot:SAG11_NODE_5112_length_1659_cov_6.078205_1_plen_84_part_00
MMVYSVRNTGQFYFFHCRYADPYSIYTSMEESTVPGYQVKVLSAFSTLLIPVHYSLPEIGAVPAGTAQCAARPGSNQRSSCNF